ncbi:MAG: glycosyltransferase [Endomicrobia bacterium]|nr:glycosyltransferase [Endomicrobiia bacterium]
MNILIAYRKTHPFTAGEYLELALAKEHTVISVDFASTPYWTNFYNTLPFYFPKGKPLNICKIIKELGIKKDLDLIIEVDGMGQFHLTGYQKTHIPSVLWGIDHDKSKLKFLKFIKKDFTKMFYCHKNLAEQFGCEWLAVACDPEIHKNFGMKKIYDVVFVGNIKPNYSKERHQLLLAISERYKLEIFSGVYGEEMAKIYSQAKIIFNKSISFDLNMRVFEAMACGSMLITNRLPKEAGLEEIFVDGKHLVLYNNEKDLIEKIGYYLSHDTEREEIAYNGYLEVTSKHTYWHRAQEILKVAKSNKL